MLIHDGDILKIGDPKEIARSYLRLNFSDEASGPVGGEDAIAEDVRLLDCWIEAAAGERTSSVEHGEKVRLHAEIEALHDVESPRIGFLIASALGASVFEFGAEVDGLAEGVLRAGEQVRVAAELENPLGSGRYYVGCGVSRRGNTADIALYEPHATDFVVYGAAQFTGIVALQHEIEVSVERKVER
jgi:hypothetical protein